jgi:iron complex outermembrane recepter protein
MKKILTIITLSCITLSIFGQKITVKAHDQEKNIVEFATVALLAAKDSAIIKGEITDMDGNAVFENVPNGQYLIKSSFVGLQDHWSEVINMNNQDVNVVALLAPTSQQLNEVTITAKKPIIEVNADRLILNPDASISMAGISALDLLRKAPGVVIDNNDGIQLKGKNGVRIYIDGKPSQLTQQDLANLLRNMTSNDIEAVEIITNPSAKYDAQGNAGIINIRLKKNRNFGTNGSASLGLGYGDYHKANANLTLNNRQGKLNTFGNVGIGDSKWYNEMSLYRLQDGKVFDSFQSQVNHNKPVNAKLGMDYYFNNKHTFGYMVNGFAQYGPNRYRSNSQNLISTQQREGIDSVLVASNNIDSRSINFAFNANYKYSDTSGNEFVFDIDRGLYRSESFSTQPNEYLTSLGGQRLNSRTFTNDTPSDIDIFTVKGDYTKTLKSSGWNLGTGFKYSSVKSDNTFVLNNLVDGNEIKDIFNSNEFFYDESVSALYVNANGKLGKKFSTQLGLRMEHTNSEGDLVKDPSIPKKDEDNVLRSYTGLFPSAALTYTINDKNVLNFTYSRRLDRPNYRDLNPFEWRLDELTFRKGNPFLKPSYNNNVEMSYTFLQAATLTASYSKSIDQVSDIIERDPNVPNVSYIMYRNIANREQYNIGLNTPLPINKWWTGYMSLSVYQTFFNATFPEYSFDTKTPIAFNGYAENSFKINDKHAFEISGWFNSASVWGGTFLTKPQGSLDLAYRLKFADDKANLKIGFTDILMTAAWNMQSDVIPGLNMVGSGRWESRRVTMNLSYRFGNNNVKSARKRATGSESEAKRLGGN